MPGFGSDVPPGRPAPLEGRVFWLRFVLRSTTLGSIEAHVLHQLLGRKSRLPSCESHSFETTLTAGQILEA